MDAKRAAGYFSGDRVSGPQDPSQTRGRGFDDY